MSCLAVKGNACLRNKFPVAAICNQIAVINPVIRIRSDAVCYITVLGIVLKHLYLSNLRRARVNADKVKRAVLAIDHGNGKHTTVHHEIGTECIHAPVTPLESEVLHPLENDCHLLGVILVVITDIILAHIGTVGVEIVLTTLEEQHCRFTVALGLDSLNGSSHLGSHVLARSGHYAEVTCMIDFLIWTARYNKEQQQCAKETVYSFHRIIIFCENKKNKYSTKERYEH